MSKFKRTTGVHLTKVKDKDRVEAMVVRTMNENCSRKY